jgi:hypothetical protein
VLAIRNTLNIHLQTHDDLLLVTSAKGMFAAPEFQDERCAFSKHCPPANYVIGEIIGSRKAHGGMGPSMAFCSADAGSASVLTSCWNLLSCAISARCCSEQAHGVHASAE